MSLSRRTLVKSAAAVAGTAAAFPTGFPTIWAQNIKNVTLRQFGTGVSSLNPIAERVKQDLGFSLAMTALDTDATAQKAVTQPRSYDVADIEYFLCKKVYPTNVLQPIDTRRIKQYGNIVPLFTTGKLTPTSTVGQGTAPHTVSFTEGPGSTKFTHTETGWMTLLPTIYNADTLGIRPDLVGRPISKWADLVDPAFKGRASILNIPGIGIMDAAMVQESLGRMTYADKGNMTRDEIDKTVAFLIETKHAGQFRAFWKSFDESVNLMAAGEVVIQSMWSPAVTAGGLGIARHLDGIELDAAYEYLNWYLSGWVGAYLNRQGYYSAVLGTAKENMSADEWGYWMEGKAAAADITSPDGKTIDRAGAKRDGGSFTERMSKVACWNSVMDQDRYMVQKWNEFVAA